ncbi:energy transducer TonB [Desulfomicrobium norvegicum]|nr:energy transducer TonB [Desulfomicrobium norvegicum]
MLCALLIHALALTAFGIWLGPGGAGSSGPMLMALELSGGGAGGGTSSGGQAGADESSLLPLLGDSATEPSSARTQGIPPTPPAPEAQNPITEASPAPALPAATKAPAQTPISQARVEPNPPKQIPTKQPPVRKPVPEPKIQTPERTPDAGLVTADSPPDPVLNSPGDRTEHPEARKVQTGIPKLQAGAASPPQGTGQDNRPGAAGAGTGAGARGSGGNRPGGSDGAGDSLVKFGTPGGPGIVRMAQPRYPHEARRLGKEGIVVLRLALDEAGAVRDVEVLRGVGFGMEEASREAVLLSRFRPATIKGRPVACQVILPIHFKLR